MGIKFSNNAYGTLNASISTSDTSLTLSSGQGARFPILTAGDYFYATLIDTSNNLEVVKCTARSSDVLTVTRAQESTTARAFAIGDRLELRVTAAALEDTGNPYDKDTTSTGSFALPVGTTAQQPAAADTEGHIRYDSDDNVVYYSDGTSWLKISSVVPVLSSATGNLFAGGSSALTLAGTGFQAANLVVNFTQSSDAIDVDVTVTPTSDTAATVTVPSSVYNNVTAGNVVSITVTNSDGATSAAVSKTAAALPSGGTVTTSGSYRIHTFTSSGTFTISSGVSLSDVEYLVVAGGGGGGFGYYGGGGGAGGYRSSVSGESSGGGASAESKLALSAGSYTVTVGSGGSGSTSTTSRGSNGGDSVFSSITSTGGGGGGSRNNDASGTPSNGSSGGSGGGGSFPTSTGGSGTSGQGYKGSTVSGSAYGGGGGGAGAAAVDGSSGLGSYANGGIGVQSSINGSATYRAGGGGGGGNAGSYSVGTGGTGGGGNGGDFGGTGSTAATVNTGGGGGGQGANSSGSNGGSGIVIIRYQL